MLKLGFIIFVILIVVFIVFWNRNSKKYEISSLDDDRLVLIDPTKQGFFDIVMNYSTQDYWSRRFIDDVREITDLCISPFYTVFLIDPSIDKKGNIVFKNRRAEVDRSFNWWKDKISKMPSIEGKSWKMGNEVQYLAFLVYLINYLVNDQNWLIDDVFNVILCDGNKIAEAGSFSFYIKILSCSDTENPGYYLVGGLQSYEHFPLYEVGFELQPKEKKNKGSWCCVAWPVLS